MSTPPPSRPQCSPAELLERFGTTYAAEAGITLRDEPSPLYQLLVLTTLASARISADVATATAKVLFARGWRTPQRMRDSSRRERVVALGEGGYRRYDESTAGYLDDSAAHVIEVLGGDLRALRPATDGSVDELRGRLQDLPRIGPTGASIFCREVQVVWPEVAPYFDERALAAARDLAYPTSSEELAGLVAPHDVARFSAALVRWSLG